VFVDIICLFVVYGVFMIVVMYEVGFFVDVFICVVVVVDGCIIFDGFVNVFVGWLCDGVDDYYYDELLDGVGWFE